MPLPSLSPEQRAANLEKAAAARRARAELKDKLKHGSVTLAEVLTAADTDEVVGGTKVLAVLEAMPGIGKVRAEQMMAKFKIAESRRVRGLGHNQRRALLEEFGSSARR